MKKYTICAIIKDEQRFLKEWLDYHLKLGFEDIHLIEDLGSKPHDSIVKDYPNVFLHHYSDVDISITNHRQRNAYLWFQKNYTDQYEWCAFIDIDEFIEFGEGYSLDKLCTEFDEAGGIILDWRYYNANGHIARPEGSVLENYTEWFKKFIPAGSFKTIVHLSHNPNIKSVHKCFPSVYTDWTSQDNNNTKNRTKAWINHYYTKSYEDFIDQILNRGDILGDLGKKIWDFFDINVFNNEQLIQCREIWRKAINYIPEKKEKKLLVVGNKKLDTNIENIVNSYDLVLRYNKMDNSDMTGTRCDVYMPSFEVGDFKKNVTAKNLEIIKKSPKFIMCGNLVPEFKKSIEDVFAGTAFHDKVSYYNTFELQKYFSINIRTEKFMRFQSMCKYILYAIWKYADKYIIDTIGFDVDRKYFYGHPWHCFGLDEYRVLAKLYMQNKFNILQ